MSAAIVANSLSSLTTLSSNPPKYPRTPGQEVRDPLVLYIARVPGSKDVFLSTLKPLQKTVTAEDVTSSLYYMHVNRLEGDLQDSEMSMDGHFQEVQDRCGKQPSRVERKPVPHNVQLSSQGHRELPREPPQDDHSGYPHSRPGSNGQVQLGRKPIAGSAREIPQSEAYLPTPSPLQNRPVGPRPMGYEPQPTNRPLGLENLLPSQRAERHPVLPPRQSLGAPPGGFSLPRERSESPTKRHETSVTRSNDPKASSTPNPTPFGSRQSPDIPAYLGRRSSETVAPGNVSITLIRRDPGSGSQWNVGTITITSALNGPLSSERHGPSSYLKSGGIPRRISVEITNPGYNQFLPPKKPPLYATPPPEGDISLSDGKGSVRWKDFAYLNGLPTQAPRESNLGADDWVFRREVWAEGAGFWDRNVKKSSDLVDVNGTTNSSVSNTSSSSPLVSENERPGLHDLGSTARRGSETGGLLAKPVARGDVFISPWDGRCEFSTGAGGRSLKCKHIPPNGHSPAQASELRFNLPTSSVFSSRHFATGAGSSSSDEANRSSIFSQSIRKHLLSSNHRHRNRSESPSATATQTQPNNYIGDDSDARPGLDRRLSIELGQEKAGGGSGGKRTKLGKLIVEDEGQKMLDLVVAVNMGLWWRAWERTNGDRFMS